MAGDMLVEELAEYTPPGRSICAIGVFDGVHLGHKALVDIIKAEAAARGCVSAAIVFHPHPRTVLVPGSAIALLTPLPERVDLLRGLGVELVLPLTFTRELSQLSAREFMGLLRQHLRLVGLVAGPDFALGRGREGTVPVLQELGRELGYTLSIIAPLEQGSQLISSTTVRQALAQGDVAAAADLLGRPFVTRGAVLEGAKRGRWLGYPTANIAPDPNLALPGDGIYATRVRLGTHTFNAVTYVGTRPTFQDEERLVEVFLLDYEGDLYGKDLRVEWVQQVREDHKFDSADALIEQMGRDVADARAVLSPS